jgi:hypothetical protein
LFISSAPDTGASSFLGLHLEYDARGEGIGVAALPRLGGVAEAPAVVGDDPVARVDERRHLLLSGRPAQRPPVDQDDRAPRAVVLVVEIDAAGVLLTDFDVGH